jgi:quercetin dioxygenase-like cupin family protein
MPHIYPLDMKYVSKPWGYELWIYNGENYCGKKLFIKQGRWLSYHHHNVKDEVLFVESGKIWFTHNEKDNLVHSFELSAGHAFHVKRGVKHQMQAIEDAVLFEFSTHHEDEDSIRTTRELMVDHGDNGIGIKTYTEPFEIPIPQMPDIHIPPINIPDPCINFPPLVFGTPDISTMKVDCPDPNRPVQYDHPRVDITPPWENEIL